MRISLTFAGLVSSLLLACAQSPEEAAADEARDDLGCEDVVVLETQAQPESPNPNTCPPTMVRVHGCRQYAVYECRAGVRDCAYTCTRK